MNPLIDHVQQIIAGSAATCAQFEVRTPDTSLSWSHGVDALAQPVNSESLFAVYCAGKPLAALAIGQLVADRQLSFDQRIAQILNDPRLVTVDATIDDVLSHSTGTWRYPAVAFVPLSVDVRRQHIAEAFARSQRPGVPTYSEFVGWEILAFIVEATTGTDFAEYVSSAVIEPLGLTGSIEVRPSVLVDRQRDIRVNACDVNGRPVPLLWERSLDNLRDVSAALGVYASMAGLADMYATLGSVLNGSSSVLSRESLSHLIEPVGDVAYDRVLARTVRHGHGFMIELDRHGFRGLTSQSFGHSGMSGMTFAGHDPMRELSLAVHINAASDKANGTAVESPEALERRQSIIALVLESAK